MGEGLEQLAAQVPTRHPATADEIAEAIVFLPTDLVSFIHGAVPTFEWRAQHHFIRQLRGSCRRGIAKARPRSH
jgi:hypothetical protein